jgi:hypothetical protein
MAPPCFLLEDWPAGTVNSFLVVVAFADNDRGLVYSGRLELILGIPQLNSRQGFVVKQFGGGAVAGKLQGRFDDLFQWFRSDQKSSSGGALVIYYFDGNRPDSPKKPCRR